MGRSLREYLSQWREGYTVDAISVRGEEWKKVSFRGYDAIYHVAAIVHMEQSKNDASQAELYDRVNARLPVEIARKAKEEGVGQFLFLSTAAVYGLTAPFGKKVVIDRNTPVAPKDNYGISKARAEQGLLELADEKFRVAILRPPMIYGKGCKGNYNALASFAGKLPVFPKVDNSRSMLYIENLCELVRLIIDRQDSGIFCPQDRQTVNTCEMVRLIAAEHGKNIRLIPGLGWAMRLLRQITSKVDKAFGSLCYEEALSRYEPDYRVADLREAIHRTET